MAENISQEEVDVEDLNEEDKLVARHRKEKKELQAKIQSLKKSATKGDKKKRKEVMEEIAKLEKDLSEKHESEMQQLGASKVEPEVNSVAVELSSNLNIKETRITKAQKRRDKKAEKGKERDKQILEQEEANLQGERHKETLKIKELLRQKGLTFYDVPSDGNCMYVAIQHQIGERGKKYSVSELRKAAADFMLHHREDFLPFMENIEGESQFVKYCNEVEATSAWGSQLELRALSQVLQCPIEVWQAEGRPVVIGEEFLSMTQPILLTYHRHMYGLGEHYNSVKPVEEDDDNEL